MPDYKEIKDCVFVLLQYCERILSEKNALLQVIQSSSFGDWQSKYKRARLEVEKKDEPTFHTLHAFYRDDSWKELHDAVLRALEILKKKL